jgi:molecular chaperone DnaK
MAVVGIDLGTSNSAVAVYRRGRVESLLVDGSTITPSCIAVNPQGGLLVGRRAKQRAQVDPEQTVRAIKRQMGDRDYSVSLEGRQYSPVDLSSLILRKLVDAAGEQLGEPVKRAVISVPAYFTNAQKEDTLAAGEKAGIDVLRLLPEPTAAAIAYGLDKGRDQTIMVYDLGGGTFDVSVLRVKGNDFEVIGVGGDDQLGGEDFDKRLIEHINAKLRSDARFSTLNAEHAAQLEQQLKEAAEAAKKQLSDAESADVEIPEAFAAESFCLTITRSEYEAAIRNLVDRSLKVTRDTLKLIKQTADDIDRVVLVGGSTRIPLIQKLLADNICEPYIADNVDGVVAHGAAILAASLTAGVEAGQNLAPIEVTNCTAHSLGIRADRDDFAVLVPRGTKLPAVAEKTFTTARDNADRTDVVVFQGEAPKCSDNVGIGGFAVTEIQRAAAGVPRIDVKFAIDENDILTVSAADKSTGLKGQVKIEKFEAQPYEEQQEGGRSLDSIRIGVSPEGCDDAGAIFRRLGMPFRTLRNCDFRKRNVVDGFDVLFINCLCDASQLFGSGRFCKPTKNRPVLQDFVKSGGVLYVSDYAFENINQIFPGMIKFAGRIGVGGNHNVTIVDDELAKVTGGKKHKAEFGPAYVAAHNVAANCTVHIKKGEEPVLVSFPFGEGRVVYTAFHNAPDLSESMLRVVSYIMLQTISFASSTPLVEIVESTNLSRIRP